jgi:hypothetical protein
MDFNLHVGGELKFSINSCTYHILYYLLQYIQCEYIFIVQSFGSAFIVAGSSRKSRWRSGFGSSEDLQADPPGSGSKILYASSRCRCVKKMQIVHYIRYRYGYLCIWMIKDRTGSLQISSGRNCRQQGPDFYKEPESKSIQYC